MRSDFHTTWGVRFVTWVLWAAAAASAAYWGLALSSRAPQVAVPAMPAAPVAADAQAIARVLGAWAAPAPVAQAAPVSSRFALVGVLAGQGHSSGAALIAVDGKPARPYRVGAPVEDGLVLQSLSARQAQLGAGGDAAPTVTLEMPLRR